MPYIAGTEIIKGEATTGYNRAKQSMQLLAAVLREPAYNSTNRIKRSCLRIGNIYAHTHYF